MEWWQALVLGVVQGLTEFLPVSSSGHLMLVREILGVDGEGFLDFTVAVHFATVVSTVVVFRKVIVELLKGLFKFRYNDETDYVCKILVSMIPVGVIGVFFKDSVEALFGNGVTVVGICLLVTAFLLFLSDVLASRLHYSNNYRNGISYWQDRHGSGFCCPCIICFHWVNLPMLILDLQKFHERVWIQLPQLVLCFLPPG